MSQITEIQQQIEALEAQKQKLIAQERSDIIEKIKAQIATYEIKASELGFKTLGKIKAKRGVVPPKYKGPKGELWSGRGRKPAWFQMLEAQGLSTEQYLIK
ncbi:MAG: H-NS histone family protein [Candidatus Accumulibacter sp.]|jgi:DNA-binding protein H-NS|nr:H-NS histone family protein [Accumulibacter sp.]